MIRKIIKIDEERCDGCGLCANACAEGALAIRNGKATLIREDYCDGLGNCLPVCPQDAISFEEREALPFTDPTKNTKIHSMRRHKTIHSVRKHQKTKTETETKKPTHSREKKKEETLACGCSVHTVRSLKPQENTVKTPKTAAKGMLSQWPVQIKLLPTTAPFYENASILVAADCSAYAYNGFHEDFIKGSILLVGCPKLDSMDYSEKLTEIFSANTIKDITLTRMEVPCCGGMEKMVKTAIANSGKILPLNVVTISAEGDILKTEKF